MNKDLTDYFNGSFVPGSKISRLLFSLFPINLRLKFTAKLIVFQKKIKRNNVSYTRKVINISDSITNQNGRKMFNYLNGNLFNNIAGAYVHGSLGTGEEIPYSDFDALVILKDEVFESTKRIVQVAEKLIKAKKIIYQMDPLQHHGWFILTESDLKNYPQTYFPHELFEYAKSLFPDKGTKLEIYLNKDGYDYIQPFHNLANSIIKKIESGKLPKNMYQLKGILSQFMLLPALYVQARDNKGVYKKFSFDLARKDFSIKDWEIMDEVSEIRINWHYKMGFLKRKLFTITNPFYRKLITRYLSPKIPEDIKINLTSEFYKSMKELCKIMSEKI